MRSKSPKMANTPVFPIPSADTPAPAMKRVGVHDDKGFLIGASIVSMDTEGVDIGDLPTNSSYKWDGVRKAYIPLGHGFDKVRVHAPYSTEYVLARLIEAAGDAAPIEARDWLDWYNVNLRLREEELSARKNGR